jgi:hypothetical protein
MRASDIEWMKRTKRVKLTRREALSYYFFVIFPGLGVVFFGYYILTIALDFYDGRQKPEEIVKAFFISFTTALAIFFYLRRNLKFKTITVEHDVDHFQDAIRRTAKQRHWAIESDKAHFMRAYRHEDGFLPGNETGEMITFLRDGNTLYLNSVSSPKLRSNIFSFRQNRINLRLFLINLQESILDIPPNNQYEKQQLEKAEGGRFIRTLAVIFSVVMVVGGIFMLIEGVYWIAFTLILIGGKYLHNDWNMKKEQNRLAKEKNKTDI